MTLNDLTNEFQNTTQLMHQRMADEGIEMTGVLIIVTTTGKSQVCIDPHSSLATIAAAACHTADALCSIVEAPPHEDEIDPNSGFGAPPDFDQPVA